MRTAVLWIALLSALCVASSVARDCYGATVVVEVSGQGADPWRTYGYPSALGSWPGQDRPSTSRELVAAAPLTACAALPPAPSPDAAALVARGNCSFAAKAAALRQGGYGAMLIFDPEEERRASCLFVSRPPTDPPSSLLVASVTREAAAALLARLGIASLSNGSAAGAAGKVASQPGPLPDGSLLGVRIWQPPFPTWDFSPLLLWTLASFIVFAGSSLASADALRSLRLSHRRGSAEAPAAPKPLAGEEASLGVSAALGFVVIASCVLLLLYFFRSRWLLLALSAVYALGCTYPLALFATRLFSLLCPALAATGAPGATRALSRLGLLPESLKEDASGELVQPLAPEGQDDESRRSNGGLVDGPSPLSSLPAATLSYADLAGWTVAACICLVWLLFPLLPGSWALQNLMGGAFIALLLKDVVVPNLRVSAALLVAAAVYDVWWVFLQPRVTGGPSIMVDVAGGGGGEHFPGTLLAPQTSLGDSPAMAVLGFGDVALPGLLVALCARWDGARAFEHRGRSVAAISSQSCCRRLWDRCGCAPGLWGPRGYAIWALCAYGLGLALTYGALFLGVGGQGGQPALLYLAPTTLAAVGGLAWARGEFWGLWRWGSEAQEDVGEV